MKQILLIFATRMEAKPTLEALEARPKQWLTLDHGNRLMVTISGMGPIAATRETTRWIDDVDEVWNFGVAGALHHGLESQALYRVATVGKHLSLPPNISHLARKTAEQLFQPLAVAEEGLRLITSDYPIYDTKQLDSNEGHWDLVDMEGYGICHVAEKHEKSCHLCKLVSDFADGDTIHNIREGYKGMTQKLAEAVIEQVEALAKLPAPQVP